MEKVNATLPQQYKKSSLRMPTNGPKILKKGTLIRNIKYRKESAKSHKTSHFGQSLEMCFILALWNFCICHVWPAPEVMEDKGQVRNKHYRSKNEGKIMGIYEL